jgi:hypothetical protein
MRKGSLTVLALGLLAVTSWAAVPAPKEHFGFTPGDDYKLADYTQIRSYFQKLAESSDRIRLVDFGRTSNGKPMLLAFISSAENLKELERYREISRRLALGEAVPEEARRLASEGKAIVWIDSGLHASEVAPAQHAPELAWRMVSEESDEVRRIRQNVILLQVPVINPDGLDMVAEWYRRNVGTPYELARLPWLYQKYAGHDNNRDWFMLNLEETRNVSRVLFREWFPQIVYNQHQSAPFPARIFVPPYADPLNPNIPAAVMEGVNQIGSAISERLARENKPGAISFVAFDAWWDGGLRSVPSFHNMHGVLTETAGYGYATPHEYKNSELPDRFPNGLPTREPTVFYPLPWQGGLWRLRDAVDYLLTSDFAVLDLAAARSSHFLLKAYELARAAMEAGRKGNPYAYVLPPEQRDRSNAIEMLRRLAASGVRVERARAKFQAGSKTYPEGTWVLPAAQPFRAYLVDLLEPQKYPELRAGSTGPTRRPYDIAGWTLSMQMGVSVDRVDAPFEAALDAVGEIAPAARDAKPTRSRVALYEPYTANIDTGWTEWLLDEYRIPYTLLRNAEVRKGGLHARFDSLILASQSATSILHGARPGEKSEAAPLQRPEYTGGIGIEGLHQIETFVREGGTLIAFDQAAELPIQFFPLPVRNVGARGLSDTGFYCPGSLVRVTVDTENPLAAGMPKDAIAFSEGGHAWEITLLPDYNQGERETRSVVEYAKENLLASGWVSGEKPVLGKSVLIDARYGRGRVVLFGFRPQFRGQSFGTFKLILNAISLVTPAP